MKRITNGWRKKTTTTTSSTTTTTTSGSTTTTTTSSGAFNWDILEAQAPTDYSDCGTVLVENKSFTNMDLGTNNGNDVTVTGACDITFRNCYFGPSIRKGVSVYEFTGTCIIEDCLFVSNEAAIEFADSTGGNVQIDNCQCINPWGRPNCKGQFIQMAFVSTPNSYVTNCRFENFRGEGNTEDWISLFAAYGTSLNPIRIAGNYARGGGSSSSGGGFMSGDTDGAWQLVEDNKLYKPGNYLFAIASGENITVRNNMAYAENDGLSTIAMYIYGGQNGATTCGNLEMSGNSVNFWNPGNLFYGGDGSPSENCGDIVGVGPNYVSDPNGAWQETNDNNLTLGELAFPTVLIDFVNEDLLWELRNEAGISTFRDATGGCIQDEPPYHRPTANSENNKSVSTTSTTISSAGSVSSNGFHYNWVFVSGPTTPSLVNSTSSIVTVNNMTVNGVYRIRLELTDDDGASSADWTEITKI